MVTRNFSTKFSGPQNLPLRFPKMTYPCSFKRRKTIFHWKLYSNHFWLFAGRKNDVQQYSLKSILNISRDGKNHAAIFLGAVSVMYLVYWKKKFVQGENQRSNANYFINFWNRKPRYCCHLDKKVVENLEYKFSCGRSMIQNLSLDWRNFKMH